MVADAVCYHFVPVKDLNMGMLFEHSNSNLEGVSYTGTVFRSIDSSPSWDWSFKDTSQHSLNSLDEGIKWKRAWEFGKW